MQALAKESQKPNAKKSPALHISGASIASACAASVPAFAGSYSVHPCTPTAIKEGRCAERQQYHLRNSTAGDEVTPKPALRPSCLRNARHIRRAVCLGCAAVITAVICLLSAQRPP